MYKRLCIVIFIIILLGCKGNAELKEMKEDGTTSKISQKWFGNDLVVE